MYLHQVLPDMTNADFIAKLRKARERFKDGGDLLHVLRVAGLDRTDFYFDYPPETGLSLPKLAGGRSHLGGGVNRWAMTATDAMVRACLDNSIRALNGKGASR